MDKGKWFMIPQEKWKWFGHPGHYCCADRCLFHLCTQVGKYLISSVGEMPNSANTGLVDIGCNRKYEAMVFKWKNKCNDKKCGCDMPEIIPSELEMLPSNNRDDAQKNHMKLCKKYSNE